MCPGHSGCCPFSVLEIVLSSLVLFSGIISYSHHMASVVGSDEVHSSIISYSHHMASVVGSDEVHSKGNFLIFNMLRDC